MITLLIKEGSSMKFYILCDIEGVASLACWDEAR